MIAKHFIQLHDILLDRQVCHAIASCCVLTYWLTGDTCMSGPRNSQSKHHFQDSRCQAKMYDNTECNMLIEGCLLVIHSANIILAMAEIYIYMYLLHCQLHAHQPHYLCGAGRKRSNHAYMYMCMYAPSKYPSLTCLLTIANEDTEKFYRER